MGGLLLGAWFSRWLERHVPSVDEDVSALDRADGLGRAYGFGRADGLQRAANGTEAAETPPPPRAG